MLVGGGPMQPFARPAVVKPVVKEHTNPGWVSGTPKSGHAVDLVLLCPAVVKVEVKEHRNPGRGLWRYE